MSGLPKLGLLAALGLALTACSEPVAKPPPVLPSVLSAPVVALDVEEHIEAPGELLAPNHTTVAAEVSGRITEIRVPEGSAVDSGAVVLEIDPQRRRLEFEAARARAAQADANLEKTRRQAMRVGELFRSRVTSQVNLDQAETDMRLAEANLDAERAELGVAERALADASVGAPFAGLVARRLVNVGEFVQPGTPLFEVVSLDPIEVSFHLSEVDSGRVALGQQVDVRVAPHPDEVFRAQVKFVSPTIDTSTRTLLVKAEVPNPDGRLRPGLFASADLGVAVRRAVPMVPEEAILQRSDGSVLFLLRDRERVERRVVQTGAEQRGMVEVLEGVVPGELVVQRGHSGLIDGAQVKLRSDNGTTREPALEGFAQRNDP